MKLWVEMEITFFRISYDISLLSKTTPTKSALMVSGSEIEKLKEHQAVCHLKWNINKQIHKYIVTKNIQI